MVYHYISYLDSFKLLLIVGDLVPIHVTVKRDRDHPFHQRVQPHHRCCYDESTASRHPSWTRTTLVPWRLDSSIQAMAVRFVDSGDGGRSQSNHSGREGGGGRGGRGCTVANGGKVGGGVKGGGASVEAAE